MRNSSSLHAYHSRNLNGCQVKTYPDLSVAARKLGRDRELAVWYLLRFVDSEGNGRVHRQALEELIEHRRLMSMDNLRRRLRRGQGVFWILAGDWILYKSLAKVSEALEVLPGKSPVAIPLDAFKGLARLRGYLYATWLNQGSNPISRQTIERETGISKQSQIRYEKAAHVRKEKNLGIKSYERGDQVPAGGFVSRDGSQLNVPMPNSFMPLLQQLPRGQLKKVRRKVRGLLKERPNEIRRRYFGSGKQAARCKRRSEVYFVDRRRQWNRYRLWELCRA